MKTTPSQQTAALVCTGAIVMSFGVLISLTIIGAIIGVPMFFVGLALATGKPILAGLLTLHTKTHPPCLPPKLPPM